MGLSERDERRELGITCKDLKAAMLRNKNAIPVKVLAYLVYLETTDWRQWNFTGVWKWGDETAEEIPKAFGSDAGVIPTSTRLSYNAYLKGYIDDSMLGGRHFWELSDVEMNALYNKVTTSAFRHEEILRQVNSLEGNLDTAVQFMDYISETKFPGRGPKNWGEWIQVIVIHSQGGGPEKPTGSNRAGLREDMKNELGRFLEIYKKYCECE